MAAAASRSDVLATTRNPGEMGRRGSMSPTSYKLLLRVLVVASTSERAPLAAPGPGQFIGSHPVRRRGCDASPGERSPGKALRSRQGHASPLMRCAQLRAARHVVPESRSRTRGSLRASGPRPAPEGHGRHAPGDPRSPGAERSTRAARSAGSYRPDVVPERRFRTRGSLRASGPRPAPEGHGRHAPGRATLPRSRTEHAPCSSAGSYRPDVVPERRSRTRGTLRASGPRPAPERHGGHAPGRATFPRSRTEHAPCSSAGSGFSAEAAHPSHPSRPAFPEERSHHSTPSPAGSGFSVAPGRTRGSSARSAP